MSSQGEGEPDEIAVSILELLLSEGVRDNETIAETCADGDKRLSGYRLSILVKLGLVESRSPRRNRVEDFGLTRLGEGFLGLLP